jgi:predicted RNase H-like HicB family nuclease
MARFTATVEQAGDGTWTAAMIGEHTVLGTGATKDEALDDLRKGVSGLIEHLKANGMVLQPSSVEIVSIEVAA